MSKNGKMKYRWVDEEVDDNDYKNKKKGRDRKSERRINTALKSKNFDHLIYDDEK